MTSIHEVLTLNQTTESIAGFCLAKGHIMDQESYSKVFEADLHRQQVLNSVVGKKKRHPLLRQQS